MYKNQFQGNSFFELFSAQGSSPLINWKINGSKTNIEKIYNKDVKGFSYNLKNNAYISLPKENKQSCHLIHPFLVLQVYIPSNCQFTLECGITNVGCDKGRIVLSTSIKSIKYSSPHISLPLTIMKRDVWMNLCVDLENITRCGFKEFNGLSFKTLNYIKIYSTCKLRRVFTMKYRPPDTTGDDYIDITEPTDSIPKNLQFNHGIESINQIISFDKIINYLNVKEINDTSVYQGSKSLSKKQSQKVNSKDTGQTTIAFGRKILIPLPTPKHLKKKILKDNNINNINTTIITNNNNDNYNNNISDDNKSISSDLQKKMVSL
ncbi:hypothetical protein BCR36DRAFT_408527 [Piromyces finnis]|uniref:CFA20 domain-containing protein n=1 Tax=Piromyces finnis TaxID=1754191 RepID=A0A1Y1VMN8_9FUNG|nr:hypothetical protein BCR36DRAFT_408527 [Piromyces finnis]|eukprot:ORX60168.1 hypothetical protein BCR36DRAFT_408527 [Piromyces finnis]